MNTQSVSGDHVESTRKLGARIQSDVLRRLADVTQQRAATCMGVDASTVSRSKEDLEKVCHLLAALGLQVAPLDAMIVSRADMEALERMAFKYLQTRIESDGRRF